MTPGQLGKHTSLTLPLVFSITGIVASLSFMGGKYFTQIEHNTNNNLEVKKTLARITDENKKLWEYILENSDTTAIKAKIIEDVIDR